MQTLPYGATSLLEDTESPLPPTPRRSASRIRAPKAQTTDLTETPMPALRTVDSAVADLANKAQSTVMARDVSRRPSEASVTDSAFNMNSPSVFLTGSSGSSTLASSNIVVEEMFKAPSKQVDDDLSKGGMHDARAAAKSAFTERFSMDTTFDPPVDPTIIRPPTASGVSRASSLPISKHQFRRKNTNVNLRLFTDFNGNTLTERPSSTSTEEERSPNINTWDDRQGCQVSRFDTRHSTVRELCEAELPGIAETIEDVQKGFVTNLPHIPFGQEPVLHPHRHSYCPHRSAPSPPNPKTRNPVKRFCEGVRSFDERWEARQARKSEMKKEKMVRRQEMGMMKIADKKAREEKESAAAQTRRDSTARARDAKVKIKRDFEAHRERQGVLEVKVKENAVRQKREMAEREKAAKLVAKERKRQDATEEKMRKERERMELGREIERKCAVRCHLNHTVGKYDGEGNTDNTTPEEKEKRQVVRAAVLREQCDAARLKLEREERVRQRAGDVDVRSQELTWWERMSLTAPPRVVSAAAVKRTESTEDSDSASHYSQDTEDIEDAVRKVGEVDDATENVLYNARRSGKWSPGDSIQSGTFGVVARTML